MTDIQILEKAVEEIEIKHFGLTQQFLEIHQVVYYDNKPKVLRIDRDKEDGTAIVYFPVKDEKFYFAVYLDTEPQMSVRTVRTENYNSIYLNVASETLSMKELSSMTNLQSTGGWNKGDKRKPGNTVYNYSALRFEPNPEPDEFEDKLKNLLDFLEHDFKGIIQLTEKADTHIQVISVFHNGNTTLGGHNLDLKSIKRISSLNLSIDFDNYAEGKFFRD